MSKLLPILFCGMFCAAQIHAQTTEISTGHTPDEDANDTLDVLTTNARSLIGRSLQLTGTRVWADSTGKHKILAEFVKIDIVKNAVILKNSSGKEAAVLISKLSDDDQQVIEDILATRHELQMLLVLQNKILENILQQRIEKTCVKKEGRLIIRINSNS